MQINLPIVNYEEWERRVVVFQQDIHTHAHTSARDFKEVGHDSEK